MDSWVGQTKSCSLAADPLPQLSPDDACNLAAGQRDLLLLGCTVGRTVRSRRAAGGAVAQRVDRGHKDSCGRQTREPCASAGGFVLGGTT